MKKFIKGLFLEEEGQGMAEYALVLGVIAVGVVAILGIFGNTIMDIFKDVTERIGGDTSGV
ncbi:Flp family type IVb pilin [Bacillus shivajii]|uniref:Flp family type IVb pilin n=1 Tax=Bacillus shivajii TaxID=1983719 RepID=UPI001CFAD8EE|nr:Flp family type IVb pilin [Bacillus shivajii]UCZ53147.1 Flp family type IVb pilin [Bacillus shivajii]UCZ53148.1 Flp family type IVb pilin [Bacillus shivajii]UCZ53149.1 Flp family type IVb pilin [Bacillus shivajii]UCZ53150.1 Flp family type IVb pilin [Bacillus shivajii]